MINIYFNKEAYRLPNESHDSTTTFKAIPVVDKEEETYEVTTTVTFSYLIEYGNNLHVFL